MPLVPTLISLYGRATNLANMVAHLFNLAVRLYIAKVFFMSGLVKIQSWGSTLALFQNEYSVPLLPPDLAAYLGTAAELGLPVLLVLGVAGRFTALALFIFNIVAVVSYPDISEAGVKDHVFWGWLIAMIIFYGAGKLSVDAWFCKKLGLSANH